MQSGNCKLNNNEIPPQAYYNSLNSRSWQHQYDADEEVKFSYIASGNAKQYGQQKATYYLIPTVWHSRKAKIVDS
jgi:hypothetical protein